MFFRDADFADFDAFSLISEELFEVCRLDSIY